MIFETHAHYDDKAFDVDRDAILGHLRENNIEYVINVAASVRGCHDTLRLIEQYPYVYGALGIHPDEVGMLGDEDIQWIAKHAAGNPKIVAIGEIGLDYYVSEGFEEEKTSRKEQAEWFARQLEVAREVSLPVMIHSREAEADTEQILKAHHAEEMGGIIHCYSYSKESARAYLDMGFYLGIGGVVTFKNGRKLKEVVAYAPMDRLVLETDSPYLAPVPNRGKRNSSLNLPLVAEEIARIKGFSYEEVLQITNANAKRLLNME